MRYDYHVHSTYSDGRFLYSMLRAAEDAGLDGVGFADHCNVSTREGMCETKYELGFNFDLTYQRRRRAIETFRDRFDVEVYDAVEMDYDPRDEAEIRGFLEGAGFEYAIGSVHYLDGVNVHVEPHFARKPREERAALVDEYFERLVDLVDTGLFEVAAHVDLVERNPALRGFADEEHYERVAEAFERSRTVPEVNAGRAFAAYGEVHPASAFLDVLAAHGVDVVPGTDAHQPGEIGDRAEHIEGVLDGRGIEPVTVPGL